MAFGSDIKASLDFHAAWSCQRNLNMGSVLVVLGIFDTMNQGFVKVQQKYLLHPRLAYFHINLLVFIHIWCNDEFFEVINWLVDMNQQFHVQVVFHELNFMVVIVFVWRKIPVIFFSIVEIVSCSMSFLSVCRVVSHEDFRINWRHKLWNHLR